jgi:hypothetical protein
MHFMCDILEKNLQRNLCLAMEPTYMPNNQQMNKENVIYTHIGVSFSYKEEWNWGW